MGLNDYGWLMIQGMLLLLFSPLVNGIIKKVKARIQRRVGPSILQSYRDVIKFLKREAVTSYHTSWITSVTPYVCFSAYFVAGSMIPLWRSISTSDVIVFIYLFALARFFLALSALEPASAFGGMGSSREMMIATLVEPVLVLGLFGMVAFVGTTDLGILTGAGQNPAGIFAFIGLLLVTVAETGRIPVDNPDTHLELTMVHEGMLLEYSGRQLGLLHLAAMVKQTILLVLLVQLFFPAPIISAPWFFLLLAVKVVFLGFILALIESTNVKMRLFRLPELLVGGAVFCIISIFMKFF
ncbi:MAG: formate hydrogenlyase [Peptococcaceae bacterium]|nr:formate hydrogenlyase [Peptococcaceae bacterium]